MLMGLNENPYKKLLEDDSEDFLSFEGDTKFTKEYGLYKGRTLKNEEFKHLNFQKNREAIKEIIETYLNDKIDSEHSYMDEPSSLNDRYVDSVDRETFNNWVYINEDDLSNILKEYEDSVFSEYEFSDAISKFIEKHKEDFEIYFNGSSTIGYINGLGSDEGSLYFDNDIEIEILGKAYNFIDLMKYLPTEFIEELSLKEDINDSIISSIHKDTKDYIEVEILHYYPYSIPVYLRREDELKDTFLDFLKEEGYYKLVQSEDNSVWEEE